jgi:hypothetical protein
MLWMGVEKLAMLWMGVEKLANVVRILDKQSPWF